MSKSKKISELFNTEQLSDDDEFLVVDKSEANKGATIQSGPGGRTTKITFRTLKSQIGSSGPVGEKGDRGAPGPRGEIGPPGPAGPPGPVGGQAEGIVGPAGPQGPQGVQGPTGPVGPRGEIGPQGPTGVAAARGPKGEKGDIGPRGPSGPTGPQGLQGDRGKQGVMGYKGDIGPIGPKGNQGPKGDRGEIGPQGPRGLQGNIGPRGPAGAVAAQGPKGDRGSIGPMGPMGPRGIQGVKGAKGDKGDRGLSGGMGPQGPRGLIGPPGPAGASSGITNNVASSLIQFNSGIKAISNDSINTTVPFYANPKSNWPGYFEGRNLAFQIRTQSGSGGLARYADWGADGNGFARVRGQVGVGLIDGRGPDWYGTEIARFQDNGIICRRHVLIRNKWDSTRSLSLRPARINIAGHANTNFEGGELRMHYPYNIDSMQSDFAWVDMYYDYNKVYTQYRTGQLRLGHNGRAGLMISAVGHHTMDGHLYLWDGLNNSVIMQNKPGDTRNSNLVIRHAPSKTTYQDNLRLQKNNGNLGIRGVFVARQAWGVSDISKKKDIESLDGNESLEKLLKLNPVKFNWKDVETREKQMGLIAQEVEPILPSVVDDFEDFGEEHGLEDAECDPRNEDESKCKIKKMSKTVSYTELVPLLISAIQEQQKQIEELQKQISSQ